MPEAIVCVLPSGVTNVGGAFPERCLPGLWRLRWVRGDREDMDVSSAQ